MIYADNAATTRISDTAFEKMLPFLRERYGNASSQYSLGITARKAIEAARQRVSDAIGAKVHEVIFTSGGSEANSWVLRGIAESFRGETIHVITSSIEHHSVLNACHALESEGTNVTYLPVSRSGVVEIDSVKKAISPNTKLVSIMLANNEIGTIQPIVEIGQFLREKDILFHTDAVQAVGHIPVDVNKLCVDFLSASAHKFNGAKGTGFLYRRSVSKLPQLIFGGEQEHGQRAGTENIAGVVALSFALNESLTGMVEVQKRLESLVTLTAEGLRTSIPGIQINGEGVSRLPGTLNVTFPRASGESMMHLLDLKGICVSTSSACNSGKDEPSHVLLALGLTAEQAKSSIRISYGRYNTIEDAETIVDNIRKVNAKIESLI